MTKNQLRKNVVKPFIGVFARDMEAATGSQAVAGIGFKPSAVIILACITSKDRWNAVMWSMNPTLEHRGLVKTTATEVFPTGAIELVDPSAGWGARQSGTLASIDDDGFTVSWIKTGSPAAGSGSLNFIALP